MAGDYPAFRKIPRLFRELIVTEKIDGTNGLVYIEDETDGVKFDKAAGLVDVGFPHYDEVSGTAYIELDDRYLTVRAGSRNRWLTPASDNFGFAAWVRDNAEGLAELGPGHHYGEWWGAGIQRRYGLPGRKFSLFNTSRWMDPVGLGDPLGTNSIPQVPGLSVVPVLEAGVGEWVIDSALNKLSYEGSFAAPGFDRPEGVVVYHTAANAYFKVTFDDDRPKSAVAAAA